MTRIRMLLAGRASAALLVLAVLWAHALRAEARGDVLTPLAREYRALWAERTAGENLALGKPVRFSATPNYHLTAKGGTDATDLTDGKLSARLDDRIWFGADAVAWGYPQPVLIYNILIDLGAVRPVDRVVARFLGGKEQSCLPFPARIEVVVSEDGRTFHRASALEKLMPGEKGQSNWRTSYFLEEDGKPYVYPFALSVKNKARYVGVTVTGGGEIVCADELAVMAGDFDAAQMSYAGLEQVPFLMDGVVFRPAKTPLA
ncbi:MAG: hypothetical protein JXR37_18950, partial [Kiritimatiellae bacterium]|nr:hypothetical protein [Kiritimatiellia bacterium]